MHRLWLIISTLFITHEVFSFMLLSLSSLIIDVFWKKKYPFRRECVFVFVWVCTCVFITQSLIRARLVSNLCPQKGGTDNSDRKIIVWMELQKFFFPTGIREFRQVILQPNRKRRPPGGVWLHTLNTDPPKISEGLIRYAYNTKYSQ